MIVRTCLCALLIWLSSTAHAHAKSPQRMCSVSHPFGNQDLELVATSRVASGPASKAAGQGRTAFFPVTAVAVTDGVVFVSTYGSDFFPAHFARVDGRLELTGARVLLDDARLARNPFATAMRKYREGRMHLIVEHFDCQAGKLTLRILDSEVGIDEAIDFAPRINAPVDAVLEDTSPHAPREVTVSGFIVVSRHDTGLVSACDKGRGVSLQVPRWLEGTPQGKELLNAMYDKPLAYWSGYRARVEGTIDRQKATLVVSKVVEVQRVDVKRNSRCVPLAGGGG